MATDKVFNNKNKWEKASVLRDIGRHHNISNNPDRRFHGFNNIPNYRHLRIEGFNNNITDSINNIDLQRQSEKII